MPVGKLNKVIRFGTTFWLYNSFVSCKLGEYYIKLLQELSMPLPPKCLPGCLAQNKCSLKAIFNYSYPSTFYFIVSLPPSLSLSQESSGASHNN